MQLGIDPIEQVLTIFGEVNLKELFSTIKALGLDKEEWTIKAEPIIEKIYVYPNYQPYSAPWIQPSPIWVQPYTTPWTRPITWCGTASVGTTLTTTGGLVSTSTAYNSNIPTTLTATP